MMWRAKMSPLVLRATSRSVCAEAQATGAALARARCEIERLSDMVVEARLEAGGFGADAGERGRVGPLHASSLT